MRENRLVKCADESRQGKLVGRLSDWSYEVKWRVDE